MYDLLVLLQLDLGVDDLAALVAGEAGAVLPLHVVAEGEAAEELLPADGAEVRLVGEPVDGEVVAGAERLVAEVARLGGKRKCR